MNTNFKEGIRLNTDISKAINTNKYIAECQHYFICGYEDENDLSEYLQEITIYCRQCEKEHTYLLKVN